MKRTKYNNHIVGRRWDVFFLFGIKPLDYAFRVCFVQQRFSAMRISCWNALKTAEELGTTVENGADRPYRILRLLSGTCSRSQKQARSVDADHRISALGYTSILLA